MKTTKDRLLSLIMEGARQNRQEGFGLFKGDMGVCLALFVLNREKKDPAVEDFADHLIDRIYARAAKAKNAFLKSLTTFLRKSLYNAANIWYYLSTYRGAATMSMRN